MVNLVGLGVSKVWLKLCRSQCNWLILQVALIITLGKTIAMTMSFHSLLCALRRCKPILIGLRELSEGVHSLHTTLHILLLFCVLKVDTVLQ